MKKQISAALFFILIITLFTSCSKSLKSYIEDAEKYFEDGDTDEALEIYHTVLIDINDYNSQMSMGVSYDLKSGVDSIFDSLEKIYPDIDDRIDFFNGHLLDYISENTYGDFYYDTNIILDYALKNKEISQERAKDFLDFYLKLFSGHDRIYANYFNYDNLAAAISESVLNDFDKIESICTLFANGELEEYFEVYPASSNTNTEFLNGLFKDLIDDYVFTKPLILEIQGTDSETADYASMFDDEIIPAVEEYELELLKNPPTGRILPVDILNKSNGYTNRPEISVSSLYYMLPEEKRPYNSSEVDHIVMIKPLKYVSGEYVDDRGVSHGQAYEQLIGIYVYDIVENCIIDIETFIGGEAPESLEVYDNTYSDYRSRYGSSPIPDVYNYLLDSTPGETTVPLDVENILYFMY
jgi:hypothetical protein